MSCDNSFGTAEPESAKMAYYRFEKIKQGRK